MKKNKKCMVAAILCASTLLSCAACTSGSSDTTSNATSSGDTASSPTTTQASSLYTDEELAAFSALVSKYNERAGVISTATRNAYVETASNGDITLARYYTANAKRPARIEVASVWHYTAFMAMASHMIGISDDEAQKKEYIDLYAELVDSLDYYKGSTSVTTYKNTSRVTFYGVNRANRKKTANVAEKLAVYDDQMWIVMDLMDAYGYTGNTAYMKEAVRLADVCLDGWDVTLDENGEEFGGITWGPAYATKHACSNAPLIEPLVSISEAFKARGDEEKAKYYLDWAIKVYDWVNSHLKNNQGVFGDLLGTAREKVGDKYVTKSHESGIDQKAYTYNTGTVLSGAAALYRATGDNKYLQQAERIAGSAYTVFHTANKTQGIDTYPTTSQTTWFNVILLQGFIDVANAELDKIVETGNGSIKMMKYITSMQDSIDYAYDNYNKNGFLPRNYAKGWDEKFTIDNGNVKPDVNINVMDQASAAQSFAMLSEFYENLVEKLS